MQHHNKKWLFWGSGIGNLGRADKSLHSFPRPRFHLECTYFLTDHKCLLPSRSHYFMLQNNSSFYSPRSNEMINWIPRVWSYHLNQLIYTYHWKTGAFAGNPWSEPGNSSHLFCIIAFVCISSVNYHASNFLVCDVNYCYLHMVDYISQKCSPSADKIIAYYIRTLKTMIILKSLKGSF